MTCLVSAILIQTAVPLAISFQLHGVINLVYKGGGSVLYLYIIHNHQAPSHWFLIMGVSPSKINHHSINRVSSINSHSRLTK